MKYILDLNMSSVPCKTMKSLNRFCDYKRPKHDTCSDHSIDALNTLLKSKYAQYKNTNNKVQVGKDQEKAQSEKKIPTPKTEVGKKLN